MRRMKRNVDLSLRNKRKNEYKSVSPVKQVSKSAEILFVCIQRLQQAKSLFIKISTSLSTFLYTMYFIYCIFIYVY